MKETIVDYIVRSLALGGLVLFGLRAFLPVFAAAGELSAMIFSAIGLVAAGAAGFYGYRCAYRCEDSCALATCRIR